MFTNKPLHNQWLQRRSYKGATLQNAEDLRKEDVKVGNVSLLH